MNTLMFLYLGCGAALGVAFVLVYRRELRKLDERDRMKNTVERLERKKQAQEIAETTWARN